MAMHKELVDELEVLLGAARELPTDTDRYLAEGLASRLERARRRPIQELLPFGVRWRVAVGLLAFAVLAVGGPIAIHASTTASGDTCYPTVVKTYASWSAANADAQAMREKGYSVTGGEGGNGRVMQTYTRNGGCRW